MNMKLELVNVPVSDVDRAIEFYTRIGFNKDQDHTINENLRFVQLTPPGSACSISIGVGLSDARPGSVRGMQMVVDNAEVARQHMLDTGVEVGEVDVQDWGSFVYFEDPDGNTWALQQLPDYGKYSE